jgi:hypothetical protein
MPAPVAQAYGGGGDKAAGASGAWATPGRLLALFCTMCLFIYLDRGMIASNGVNGAAASAQHPGSGIQGDFSLTLFQVAAAAAAAAACRCRRCLCHMLALLLWAPVCATGSPFSPLPHPALTAPLPPLPLLPCRMACFPPRSW